jgi:chaperonin GroEL (HSP60 family)
MIKSVINMVLTNDGMTILKWTTFKKKNNVDYPRKSYTIQYTSFYTTIIQTDEF